MTTFTIGEAVVSANAHWRSFGVRAIGPLSLMSIAAVPIAVGEFVDAPVLRWCGEAVQAVASVMAYAALLRLGLADQIHSATGSRVSRLGFQWNAQEWRLLSVYVTAMLAMLAPGLMALAALRALPNFSAGLSEREHLIAVGMLGVSVVIVTLVGFIYVGSRLALAVPATIARERISLGWRLTKGHLWKIGVVSLIISAEVMLIAVALGAPAAAVLWSKGAVIDRRTLLFIGYLTQVASAPACACLLCGAGAFIYRRVSGALDPAVLDAFGPAPNAA